MFCASWKYFQEQLGQAYVAPPAVIVHSKVGSGRSFFCAVRLPMMRPSLFLVNNSTRNTRTTEAGDLDRRDVSHEEVGGWNTLNLTTEGAPPFRVCFLKL